MDGDHHDSEPRHFLHVRRSDWFVSVARIHGSCSRRAIRVPDDEVGLDFLIPGKRVSGYWGNNAPSVANHGAPLAMLSRSCGIGLRSITSYGCRGTVDN